MALGDELQGDVAALLDDADFGRNITIRRTKPGIYDPATGATGAPVATNISTRGLLLGYNDKVIDGTLIKQGDRRCLVKVKDLTIIPDIGDQVLVGNVIYTVKSFKTVELGGIVILYVLQVRL